MEGAMFLHHTKELYIYTYYKESLYVNNVISWAYKKLLVQILTE